MVWRIAKRPDQQVPRAGPFCVRVAMRTRGPARR
jgi:hypothetical protein